MRVNYKLVVAGDVTARNRHLACDLLAWMLQRDPSARPSCTEVLAHPFLSHEPNAKARCQDLHLAAQLGRLRGCARARQCNALTPHLGTFWVRNANVFPLSIAPDDCSSVQRLLDADPDCVNQLEPLLGRSALQLASMEGNVEMVEVLLDAPGVDVDLLDAAGQTGAKICTFPSEPAYPPPRPPLPIPPHRLHLTTLRPLPAVHTVITMLSDADMAPAPEFEKHLVRVLDLLCHQAELMTSDKLGRSCFAIGLR